MLSLERDRDLSFVDFIGKSLKENGLIPVSNRCYLYKKIL